MGLSKSALVHIPFHDIDILQIAWHGHYLKYFEIGRSALMQSLGLDWPDLKEKGISMPIVEAHVHYRRPLLYQAQARVEASIREYAFPELRVDYQLYDEGSAKLCAEGWTRQVYFDVASGQALFEVPAFVKLRLEGVHP